MTIRTPSSTEAFRAHAGDAPSSAAGQASPYAQPQSRAQMPLAPGAIDAVLIDAIRAAAGPYVAAPWRAPHTANDAAEITRAFAATPASATPASGASTPVTLPLIAPLTPAAGTSAAHDAVGESIELPWIDAFLDGSVETPIAWAPEVESTAESTSRNTSDEVSVEASAEAGVESAVEVTVEATVEATVVEPDAVEVQGAPDAPEAWPLAEAGEAMRELADQLSTHDASSHHAGKSDAQIESAESENPLQNSLEPLFAIEPTTPTVKPLPMWSDDDLMDIMPVTHRPSADETEQHWAAQARRNAQRDARASGDIESAARVLETLAKRVRDGDLQISGYSPDMSEAAAVAAALASLLNVRQ